MQNMVHSVSISFLSHLTQARSLCSGEFTLTRCRNWWEPTSNVAYSASSCRISASIQYSTVQYLIHPCAMLPR
ncbi:hypothetical protein F5884DRAFT_799403 [Xylogone sp. PMI_703]|nr:hypothetical protein F5884DRAFT_799403 [Xylogone sp. PMI_703]